jgi:hypothetical protein
MVAVIGYPQNYSVFNPGGLIPKAELTRYIKDVAKIYAQGWLAK